MALEVLTEDDFRTLGLEPGSNPPEVKRAYRTLVKKWHPDRHHSKPYATRALAEEKFREIDEAYKRISGNWQRTPRPGQSPPASGAVAQGIAPSGGIHTKVQACISVLGSLGKNIRSVLKKQIVPAALLITAAAFTVAKLPSFLPDRSIDGQTAASTPAPSNSTGDKPSKTAGPLLPSDIASPPSLLSPPHLLKQDLLKQDPEPPAGFFTIGSTSEEVLAIQGTPTRIQGQTWIYGLSEVQFRNGRVSRFDNFDGSLRVRMQPAAPGAGPPIDHISIGSTEEDVLLVQGPPTRVEADRWYYGFAELLFKSGRIVEYDNWFSTLRIRVQPSDPSGQKQRDFFSVGSTPDEVLAAQGTPTAIHGNRWSFGFSYVFFRDGKVHSVTDTSGTLRFTAPEPAENSRPAS